MAHHRLGETAQARKYLTKAMQVPLENPPFSWDRFEVDLLRREASMLIDGKLSEAKK